jgi:hypothetical protein
MKQRANLMVLVRKNDSVGSLVLSGEKAGTERAYEGGRSDVPFPKFLCEYLFVQGGCAEKTDEDGYVGRVDWFWGKSDYVGTALG